MMTIGRNELLIGGCRGHLGGGGGGDDDDNGPNQHQQTKVTPRGSNNDSHDRKVDEDGVDTVNGVLFSALLDRVTCSAVALVGGSS